MSLVIAQVPYRRNKINYVCRCLIFSSWSEMLIYRIYLHSDGENDFIIPAKSVITKNNCSKLDKVETGAVHLEIDNKKNCGTSSCKAPLDNENV